jgi:hypothetical protein
MSFTYLQNLLKQPLFELSLSERQPLFLHAVQEVLRHHYQNCPPYAKFCRKKGFDADNFADIYDLPYLPTALFKDTLLLSVPEKEIFRQIHSSSTTSGRPSQMALDKETNRRQSFCFTKTIIDRLGNRRFHFIVLDEPSTIGRGSVLSARSSTIRSLLFLARDVHSCVEVGKGGLFLNHGKFEGLLSSLGTEPADLIIFGFTSILYFHVILPLLQTGKTCRLPGAKILLIGGWKKLEAQKVSQEKLIEDCCRCFGVYPADIIDLYGFTEQGGMIYPTCEAGNRHTPVWSEVVVRDQTSLEPLGQGQSGLMQFIAPIQTSYPGHSVLTEDVGHIIGVDDCPCGRQGTTFRITGRALLVTETRGCGDIMAEKFALSA